MIRRATAIAHPNIALAKYWGKAEGEGNVPAVPSLSVTLAGLSTTTTVTFDASFAEDTLVLDGVHAAGRPLARAVALLDRVRTEAKSKTRARIDPKFSMVLPMPDGSLLKACWKGRRDRPLPPGDEMPQAPTAAART